MDLYTGSYCVCMQDLYWVYMLGPIMVKSWVFIAFICWILFCAYAGFIFVSYTGSYCVYMHGLYWVYALNCIVSI